MTQTPRLLSGLVAVTALACALGAQAAGPAHVPPDKSAQGSFVLDGSFVHNVGELQLNVTNWGLLGSMPRLPTTFGTAPSAMWPASSGIDHLFAAGLWIGGRKFGQPLVSTGQYETELLPTIDPLDTIYEIAPGDPGSARFPDPGEDDDGDGRLNEDPKDGRDNDGDGRIDEDFAVIGNQHFRLVMRDDTGLGAELFPDHDPLEIEVVQESFQWSHPRVDDAVAFNISVRNVGASPITDVAVGLFADADIGPRTRTDTGRDDLVGYFDGPVRDADGLNVPVTMAYMYDCGDSPGYIGFLFLRRRSGFQSPTIHSFRHFSANQTFERGGDPRNDAERYTALTDGQHDLVPADCTEATDYRVLISTIPSGSSSLEPGDALDFQMAIVVGAGLPELKANAAEIQRVFWGQWFDLDGDKTTGVFGRESYVCPDPLLELYQDCYTLQAGGQRVRESDLDENGCIWVSNDCAFEEYRGSIDLCPNDESTGCTGVKGREAPVVWTTETLPQPPDARIWPTNRRVHVFWNSEAEERTNPEFQQPNFESYHVWRVSNWDRPLGSSIETGPGSAGWVLLGEYDLPDSFRFRRRLPRGNYQDLWLPLGRNTGLDDIAYVPEVLRPGTALQSRFQPLAQLLDEVLAENPELTPDDPIRYRDGRGQITTLGDAYPGLSDWDCCYDQLDTLAWNKQGRRFYEYVDREVHNGLYYFYAVTVGTRAFSLVDDEVFATGFGSAGRPRGNEIFAVPQSIAQTSADPEPIFVVPNPATRSALADFSQLQPSDDDITGVRVEFRNLPAARNLVRIFTLSGDLVQVIDHDGTGGAGSVSWNLVSRNGMEVVSGIYLFSVESQQSGFSTFVGRFVVIR